MRGLGAVLAVMLATAAGPASAACSISAAQALSGSPYFGSATGMVLKEQGADGTLAYAHADDARIVAGFSMVQAEPVIGMSRTEYAETLEKKGDFVLERLRKQDRWGDHSVFPYDPVAWRTVEEAEIPAVGRSLVGHMEIRLTPDCVLAADFVAPSSPNLRSRWVQLISEVSGVRETAAQIVVAEAWEPEDTTPTGVKAVAGGFVSPVGVIGLIYLLLGHLRRLDPPGRSTRTVLASCAVAAVGAIAYQYPAYRDGFPELRYVDSLLLLSFVAGSCTAGTILSQRAALLGLLSAGVAGTALSAASGLGWTPDENVSMAVGAALVVMGLFGFNAWSEGSRLARTR